jgi:hypothetical protein
MGTYLRVDLQVESFYSRYKKDAIFYVGSLNAFVFGRIPPNALSVMLIEPQFRYNRAELITLYWCINWMDAEGRCNDVMELFSRQFFKGNEIKYK